MQDMFSIYVIGISEFNEKIYYIFGVILKLYFVFYHKLFV